MKRSRLKNIANLSNNPEDMVNYRRQRNLVVNMNRKAKKSLFDSVSDNTKDKSFWSICKPLFSDKSNAMGEKIILVESDRILGDASEVAATFFSVHRGQYH